MFQASSAGSDTEGAESDADSEWQSKAVVDHMDADATMPVSYAGLPVPEAINTQASRCETG